MSDRSQATVTQLAESRETWMEEAEKWKKDRDYWRQRALSAEDALDEEQAVVEDICDSTNRELARLRGERDKYFTRLKETLDDFNKLQEEHDALVSRCGHEFGTSDPDRIEFLMAEHDNELDRAGRRFETLWAALITKQSIADNDPKSAKDWAVTFAVLYDKYRLEQGQTAKGPGIHLVPPPTRDHQRGQHLAQGLGRTSTLKPAGQTG